MRCKKLRRTPEGYTFTLRRPRQTAGGGSEIAALGSCTRKHSSFGPPRRFRLARSERCGKLGLSLEPVFESVSVLASPREKALIGHLGNLLLLLFCPISRFRYRSRTLSRGSSFCVSRFHGRRFDYTIPFCRLTRPWDGFDLSTRSGKSKHNADGPCRPQWKRHGSGQTTRC